MKSLGKFPDRFIAEIARQPEAVRRAVRGLEDQAGVLTGIHAALTAARAVVFTAMGASYGSCHVPVTLLAARGVPAFMVDAAELLHFRLPMLDARTLVVCVSQSGESAELVRLTQALGADAARPRLASVTNGLDNTLARAADLALDTRAGSEAGPSTLTYVAGIVVLAAVARADQGAETAAAALECMLARYDDVAADLAAWFAERPMLTILGRGCARAAAETGALLFKEAAHLPAESLQSAQFRHGPLELAGPDLATMIVATEPRTRKLEEGLAAELVEAGAAVLVISQDGVAPAGADALRIGPVPAALAPAVAVLPAQLLAWRLAVLRGLTPSALTVADKVTTRE
jgi:glutamine---fructose-6-phosphate transaminase (isomerizing)